MEERNPGGRADRLPNEVVETYRRPRPDRVPGERVFTYRHPRPAAPAEPERDRPPARPPPPAGPVDFPGLPCGGGRAGGDLRAAQRRAGRFLGRPL